ncbi:hypothetical protein CDAR_2941, partial [Caerostris darwini]
MSSLDCAKTKALDNFEACNIASTPPVVPIDTSMAANTSFSPVCHRTRRQLAMSGRSCDPGQTDPSIMLCDPPTNDLSFENVMRETEVIETISDILARIPSCTPPGHLYFDASSPPAASRT